MLITDATRVTRATRNERILKLFNTLIIKYTGYCIKLNDANMNKCENYKKEVSEYYYKMNKYDRYLEKIIPMMNNEIITQMNSYICNNYIVCIDETMPINVVEKVMLISQKTNEMILRADPKYKLRYIYEDVLMMMLHEEQKTEILENIIEWVQ